MKEIYQLHTFLSRTRFALRLAPTFSLVTETVVHLFRLLRPISCFLRRYKVVEVAVDPFFQIFSHWFSVHW